MKTATPAKLKSGAWGARVPSTSVEVGESIEIRAKSGKTSTATVSAVVWRGSDVTLVATASLDRPASAGRGRNYDPDRFNGYGAPRGGYRRACKTDGNCSSVGDGRSCGGHDCDGY